MSVDSRTKNPLRINGEQTESTIAKGNLVNISPNIFPGIRCRPLTQGADCEQESVQHQESHRGRDFVVDLGIGALEPGRDDSCETVGEEEEEVFSVGKAQGEVGDVLVEDAAHGKGGQGRDSLGHEGGTRLASCCCFGTFAVCLLAIRGGHGLDVSRAPASRAGALLILIVCLAAFALSLGQVVKMVSVELRDPVSSVCVLRRLDVLLLVLAASKNHAVQDSGNGAIPVTPELCACDVRISTRASPQHLKKTARLTKRMLVVPSGFSNMSAISTPRRTPRPFSKPSPKNASAMRIYCDKRIWRGEQIRLETLNARTYIDSENVTVDVPLQCVHRHRELVRRNEVKL